jgi:hypothetical protein
MTSSNLSKIKPKLRTQGQVTGNFGKSKVRTNGNTDLGYSTKESISTPTTKSEYIKRMYEVLDTTSDPRIQRFAYNEIRNYLIQTNQW